MSQENEKKAPENTTGGISAKFIEYKAEFKRIIWLSREELLKSTVNVMGICIMFGVIIFVYDFIFNQGMTLIAKFVS